MGTRWNSIPTRIVKEFYCQGNSIKQMVYSPIGKSRQVFRTGIPIGIIEEFRNRFFMGNISLFSNSEVKTTAMDLIKGKSLMKVDGSMQSAESALAGKDIVMFFFSPLVSTLQRVYTNIEG